MKIITKAIILFLFLISSAYSACDFNANFGDNKSAFEEKIGGRSFPSEYPGLEIFPMLANDICPNESLDDIGIEFKFLNDQLIAINLVALNDEKNHVSEKLTLMNYTKKVYGKFNTSQNPRSYSGFEIFEKPNQFVVYKRFPSQDRMDEQLYISTPTFDKKLMQFYSKMEMEMEENNNEN
jgi:hypothetical protein